MSLATIATPRHGLASRTVRHFAAAVGLALLAIGVGAVIYAVEKYLVRPEHRFVENPASVMMNAVGLAHFWVGWLFLFTSPRLRNRPAVLHLAGWTALGAGLCWVCAWLGATKNPFVFLFFYGYFLVHEIRDQANLYQACGDSPGDAAAGRSFVRALATAAVVVLVSLLSVGYLLHALLVREHPLLLAIPPLAYPPAFAGLLGLCWLVVRRVCRVGARHYGSAAAALRQHRPLVTVYLCLLGILLLGMAAGSGGFNLIILIHAGAWLVFVAHRLHDRPAAGPRNPWTWLRGTPAGFVTLHLGVIAALLVLMALRVHAWERSGLLSQLLAGSSFPYWSLMHISMSFWRPPR